MPDKQKEAEQETPSFVPDEAATAGSEKPSVAPDDSGEDPQRRAPQDFDVNDAITKTATGGTADEE